MDILTNGKISNDGNSFFLGLNSLSSALNTFSDSSKLNTFYTQSNNVNNIILYSVLMQQQIQ